MPYPKDTPPIRCAVCDQEFVKKATNHMMCSDECRRAYYGSKIYPSLPTGTSGAMSELLVAAELMRDGWTVFRGMSPCGFCDLVAVKDDAVRMIEVRTGIKPLQGGVKYPKKIRRGVTEVAVWVTNTRECLFFPVVRNLS